MIRKKLFTLICAVIPTVTGLFTGCGEYEKSAGDKLSIVTTCFPPYDFARAVTGGDADLTMLLCPGAEAHSYEPTPLDIATIQQCDVFIYLGGEGEVWADKILGSFDTSDITIIRLSDYAELLDEVEIAGASPNGHGHSHDHSHEEDAHEEDGHTEGSGHDHAHSSGGAYDEHIWTSPANAIRCVNGIAEAMSAAAPELADEYAKNAASYTAQLGELDRDFAEMAENAPENVIVIGDKFPFRYLTHDYGLEYFAAFSGCSSESEPGVYTMAFLIDEILSHELDTVFYLEFSTKKLAEKLCDATGAEMLPLQSCHNVSRDDFESGVTYIELMRQNLNNIKEALY